MPLLLDALIRGGTTALLGAHPPAATSSAAPLGLDERVEPVERRRGRLLTNLDELTVPVAIPTSASSSAKQAAHQARVALAAEAEEEDEEQSEANACAARSDRDDPRGMLLVGRRSGRRKGR